MTLNLAVDKKIRKLCEERGISVYKLASKGGMNRNTLYQIKNCGTVNLNTIYDVCTTLNIEIKDFSIPKISCLKI